MNEFIAAYLAYAFLKEPRPKLARLWETMNDALVEVNKNDHATLVDFEELYMGVGGSSYGWYQGKFQQRTGEVFAKSGVSFIHALKKALAANPETSD